ncbi:MAG TPA: cobalamin-dependent protein [Steroidobacteraceae bacterium]|nr:cobalamin-dependent protein [Steroidobacteraceae bacterium]
MRVALISPKGPLYRSSGGIFRKSLRYQPLTLTTLAALAPPELDVQFQLFDEGTGDVPRDLDADLVGMTVITGSSMRAYELAAHYRRRGLKVVLGGPHVTLLPDEAEQHADAICTGYAEQSWPELLRDFSRGTLRRRYRQSPGLDLGGMPFARRELFSKRDYLTQAVFEATRSCAHDCEFCVAPAAWGRKQLQKPVEDVVADIRQFGARRLIFIDLNLISDRAYARELFTALVPLKIKWFGLSTSLIGRDHQLMELMARSGCSGLLIGFETVSTAALGDLGKKFNDPALYPALVADLHRLRISIQGCFVFGNDHDDLDVFARTAEFVNEVAIDLPRFAILTPFPGTPLFRRLESEGRILTRNWELYDGQHVVHLPRLMTPIELQHGHERAWKAVYSRRAIWRRLSKARVQIPIAIAANLGYRFYAHHLHTHYNCDWPQVGTTADLLEKAG